MLRCREPEKTETQIQYYGQRQKQQKRSEKAEEGKTESLAPDSQVFLRFAFVQSARVLIFVDEANVVSSARSSGRGIDWLKLRDYLTQTDKGRGLLEMVVYAGLPPGIPEWQGELDKKNKFIFWLRSHGFMVVTKEGSPAEEKRYKANVDVLMAIDAIELSVQMRPDVVVLVTGDADFAHLALQLRRRGIRVEVASIAKTLGGILKAAANEIVDLAPLFDSFEAMG
ncbi:MAG TPA: NYN domain-containing protein [Chthoniobacteraceae bacterium]|jgi:uncharacterized LabA/DUF88 family protein|nr:NYN domain-containing protein [Chthoniobacteraceae bacterium]